jgi:hypothetical protein
MKSFAVHVRWIQKKGEDRNNTRSYPKKWRKSRAAWSGWNKPSVN